MKVINKTYKIKERREKVLSLFNEGLNTIEISKELCVSLSTISNIRKRLLL